MREADSADTGDILVRAVRATQARGTPIYSFFLPGKELLRVADITRLRRDDEGKLQGFQRRAIREHIRGIVKYLNQGDVLFPNAVILALSPMVQFVAARGFPPKGTLTTGTIGTLRLPTRVQGKRAAWIVDGQQRSLALQQAKDKSLPVPVVGFASSDLDLHREQFVLVNKAKPLPQRLLNELLPMVRLTPDGAIDIRQLPSVLCDLLNGDPRSPLFEMIKRPSDEKSVGVVIDTAIINALRESFSTPLSALSPFLRGRNGEPDVEGMYALLCAFWAAVKKAFPHAWGKPPQQSRLMHSVGIAAMTPLMNRILLRRSAREDAYRHCLTALKAIAPACHWTSGRWSGLDKDWDDLQNVPRDIKALSSFLARIDHEATFGGVGS